MAANCVMHVGIDYLYGTWIIAYGYILFVYSMIQYHMFVGPQLQTHMRIIWNSNVRSFCSENVCVQLNQSHTFCHPYNTIHSMKMHCTVQSSQISRYAENTQNEQIHIWAWFYLIDAITRNSQLYHVHNKQINWAVSISNWIAYTK